MWRFLQLTLLALYLFTGLGLSEAMAANSYQVNNGATAVIDEHTVCRVVTNNSGSAIFVPTKTSAEWSAFYNNPPASVSSPPCAACNLDGANVPHGGSRDFYLTTRPCYSTCAAISQTRNCYNGNLDGSATYNKANCPGPTCASCTTSGVNWTTSSFTCNASATAGSHGTTRNVSDSAAPNVGSASFTCANGTWDEASGSCGGASCSLPWGGSINHNQSTTAYQNSSEPCGGSCTSQTRTCNNGSLSGSYANNSCSVTACASCNLPWGGSINHNQSTTAYQSSSVACGSSCTSQTRTCNDGSLSGSYSNASCSVSACASCSLPWGGSINHNQSVTAYQSSSVSCGSSCNSQTRTCNNGSLSGSYGNSSCSVGACGCSLPWGGSISNGQSVTAYQTSSVSCGSSCNSQTRTCTNGSLSGSYGNSSCSVGSCASCSLPWGGSINHGQNVTAYQNSSVPCGSSCTSQTRSCNNGSLSGSYSNSSCSVGACGCTTSGGVFIANGQCKTLWNSTWGWYGSGAGTGGCTPTCQSGSVCCNSGSLSTTYYKHSSCSTDGMPCCGGVPC